ncbi:uncharacterized protein LOC62_07G008959 [Vanrija pseudolonga]|uniref:Uncharacterized protein n=1 Tax=Vanrija pseudolonga TaxID=143232 RepID=A0AAF0YER2_9TREE|nr:hypothetical protein LOC62_07G008959 [Vanrija pseudolonga]
MTSIAIIMTASTVPLEVAALVTEHITSASDLDATATGAEGTALAVAAAERARELRSKYDHITLSRSKPWGPMDSPEHAEFTRIVSIPPHRSKACDSIECEGVPVALPKLEALRILFKEHDTLEKKFVSKHLERVLVSGLGVDDEGSDDETEDDEYSDPFHECSSYGCVAYHNFPCTSTVVRGLTSGSNAFHATWFGGYAPLFPPQKSEYVTVVIKPSKYATEQRLPVDEDEEEEEEGEDPATHMATTILDLVDNEVKTMTLVFLSEGPGISWIPESAATVSNPATWEANEHLLQQYVTSAANTLVQAVTGSHYRQYADEWVHHLVQRITIVNAEALLGAGERPPAEVEAALARVKGEFDAKVQSDLEFELAPARRTISLANGTTLEKPFSVTVDDAPVVKGRLEWISMDEYLARPGWDLALDADEVAPWFGNK